MKSLFPIFAVMSAAIVLSGCAQRFPDIEIPEGFKSLEDTKAIEAKRHVDTSKVSVGSLTRFDPYSRDVRKVIYFDTADHELSYDDREALDGMVEKSADYTNYEFEVVAHTDRHGKEDKNQVLSEKRGYAVSQYLLKRGVPSHRLLMKAHSERKPAVLGTTEYGDDKNRRVEVSLRAVD
jgi:outer membrane protein OmpA-like peptidoglycan-associated protein